MENKIKLLVLAFLMVLSASTALAQTADYYRYEYDANGNRIKRELIARNGQSHSLVLFFRTSTSLQVGWVKGFGTHRIVAKADGNSFPNWKPVSGSPYPYSTNDPGVTIVYNGIVSYTPILNLGRDTTYSFHVFDYVIVDGKCNFITNSALNNPNTFRTLPKITLEDDSEYIDANLFEMSAVSPNPATEAVNFTINSKTASDYTVELVNILGEVEYSHTLHLERESYTFAIPTTSAKGRLPSGTYLVRVISNGIMKTEKVIIQGGN